MDPELRRYLTAAIILQSLTIGYLATLLWASAERLSLTFAIVPPVLIGGVFSAVVWYGLRAYDTER